MVRDPHALVIAHRGGSAEAAANSVSAIDRTAALGFVLETDVSATRDGVAVILHPRGLARLRPSLPLPLDAAELPPEIPRLEDVLTEHRSLQLLIDVKQWPAVTPVARAIAEADAVDRVSIGTFSQARTNATAAAIRSLTGRDVTTALGPLASAALWAGLAPSDHPAPRNAQVPRRLVSRRLLRTAHAARIRVIAWTVNDVDEMRRLLDMGLDGIITD